MKVEFHGPDDMNGPVGVFLTAETNQEADLLEQLQAAVGNTPPIFSCLSDNLDMKGGQRIMNGVLDIFPGAKS